MSTLAVSELKAEAVVKMTAAMPATAFSVFATVHDRQL